MPSSRIGYSSKAVEAQCNLYNKAHEPVKKTAVANVPDVEEATVPSSQPESLPVEIESSEHESKKPKGLTLLGTWTHDEVQKLSAFLHEFNLGPIKNIFVGIYRGHQSPSKAEDKVDDSNEAERAVVNVSQQAGEQGTNSTE